MSNFAERLRQAMFDKRYKAVDVVRGTKIGASVISRYLSGMNQPSRDNLLALGKFIEVTPEWLLSSPDAPESKKPVQSISPHQDKIIELLERMVAERDGQVTSLTDEVRNLKAQVDMLKAQNDQWKASNQDRHARGREKTKKPKTKKQKVGFLRKRKKSKK